MPQEARSISDVVILIVLGEREDVLAKESRLLRVAEDQLGGQVHCLQFDYVTLPRWGEGGGRKKSHKFQLLKIERRFYRKHVHTSFIKLLATFRRTSGPIFGTREQYSPTSHRMLALAMGTCRDVHVHVIYNMYNMWYIRSCGVSESLRLTYSNGVSEPGHLLNQIFILLRL